jgi:hypothetical protein
VTCHRQIHVANGTSIQTLAAIDTPAGLTFLSSIGATTTEIHFPAAVRDWLAEQVRRKYPAPNLPAIEDIREEAERET